MPYNDWLADRGRHTEATERIYAAAAEIIARDGFDAFTVHALADKVHCSPATIYRHAGGKAAIRDTVLAAVSNRIVATLRDGIQDLQGPERVATALIMALELVRSEPLGEVMMRSLRNVGKGEWLTESPVVASFAGEMLGLTEPDQGATQWLVRIFLAHWYWPVKDPDAERQLLRRLAESVDLGG